MRVVVTAGGTGGHIYPALAIIDKIKEMEPDSEFLYIGTHNRMEKDIVPERGIPFEKIEMYGFNKKNLLKNFKTVSCIFKALKKCKKLIKEFDPDVVIGVGGYVTVPVIMSAKKLGYKTFLHEQNSIPGKSNKFLAKYCDLIGVSFSSSMEYLPKEKTILTGNPCSDNAKKVVPASKLSLGLSNDKKLVLVTLGSLGASTVIKYLIDNLDNFKDKNYEVLLITGTGGYKLTTGKMLPDNVKIIPFYESLSKIMKKADLVVSRAGASTLSEIIALAVPAILIPSPYVANNHQYVNAKDLIQNEAAIMLEEKDLNGTVLIDTIDKVINDSNKLNSLKENLKKLQIEDSSLKIYNELKRIIDEER